MIQRMGCVLIKLFSFMYCTLLRARDIDEQPVSPSTSSKESTVTQNVTQFTAHDNAHINITNLVSGSGCLNVNSSSKGRMQ